MKSPYLPKSEFLMVIACVAQSATVGEADILRCWRAEARDFPRQSLIGRAEEDASFRTRIVTAVRSTIDAKTPLLGHNIAATQSHIEAAWERYDELTKDPSLLSQTDDMTTD